MVCVSSDRPDTSDAQDSPTHRPTDPEQSDVGALDGSPEGCNGEGDDGRLDVDPGYIRRADR